MKQNCTLKNRLSDQYFILLVNLLHHFKLFNTSKIRIKETFNQYWTNIIKVITKQKVVYWFFMEQMLKGIRYIYIMKKDKLKIWYWVFLYCLKLSYIFDSTYSCELKVLYLLTCHAYLCFIIKFSKKIIHLWLGYLKFY